MPPRRQSISVQPSTHRPGSLQTDGRKRSQSMVPGDNVPSDRPALIPRKSILKAPFSSNDEIYPDFTSTNVSGPDGAFPEDATEALDSTRDFRAEVHDNTTRKSLGRRVSFASHAFVRLFDVQEQNTNSSGAPSSSPPPSSPQSMPPVTALPQDENDYPGRRVSAAPRPSAAFSENGEADMSVDDDNEGHVFQPSSIFFPASTGSIGHPESQHVGNDDVYDEDDESNDEAMDETEAIALNIRRKRSLSLAQQSTDTKRASVGVAFVSSDAEMDDDDMEVTAPIPNNIRRKQSLALGQQSTGPRKRVSMAARRRSSMKPTISQTAASEVEGDDNEPREFTIPLSKALKKPRPPSDAWLALQAVTHSGNTPDEPELSVDMDLTNALSRLAKARSSFGFGQDNEVHTEQTDKAPETYVDEATTSFTSTEDSFNDDDMDLGDRTMNVTNLLSSTRGMEDLGEDTMNGSNGGRSDYAGRIPTLSSISPTDAKGGGPRALEVPILQPASQASKHTPLGPGLGVFSAPVITAMHTESPSMSPVRHVSAGVSNPKTFISAASPRAGPPASSSTKQNRDIDSQPGVITRTARPSNLTQKATTANINSPRKLASPSKKRSAPHSQDHDVDASPSPAKKQALNSRASLPVLAKPPLTITPFSPTKNRANVPAPLVNTATSGKKIVNTMRRPSGYFAQRKSLASGGHIAVTTTTKTAEPQVTSTSPKKKAAVQRSSSPVEVMEPSTQDRDDVMEQTVDEAERIQNASALPDADEERGGDLDRLLQAHSDMQMSGVDHTAQWRAGVQDEVSVGEQDDGPPISIEQFFLMTGVKFMDELTVPRRSMHPSHLQNRTQDEDELPNMTEFVIAMNIDIPQFELYSWVAKDLEEWIRRSKDNFKQAEEEAAKMTPGLFREFSQANEEERSELLHQLKLIKANNHATAKSQWYDWKYGWVEGLYETANNCYSQLESDKVSIDNLTSRAEELLPTLREQHAKILLELEQERAEVAELKTVDPVYLAELKVTIDEQNETLEFYRGQLAESNAKLETLTEKLSDVESQKRENTQAIEEAERRIHMHKNNTRVEVFRLKDELESLEALHLWRATKIQPDLLEFIYDSLYRVIIPCSKFRPIAREVNVERFDHRPKTQYDQFPFLSEFIISKAQQHVSGLGVTNTKQIVERLSDFWSSCAQLRSQLTFLGIKYPLSLEAMPSGSQSSAGFTATAAVLFHKVKARALITFAFSGEMVTSWPMSIRSIDCDVTISYGNIDREVVRSAVRERLDQATVDDNHACLLDACVEATTRYE